MTALTIDANQLAFSGIFMKKLDKSYISQLDEFLSKKRQHFVESLAQCQEREQYQTIFQLRDNPNGDKNFGSLDLDE